MTGVEAGTGGSFGGAGPRACPYGRAPVPAPIRGNHGG